MAKTHSATEPRASAQRTFTAKRPQRGTTLVEILVVIVIFLIGILAVVQIFPRGFRLLLTTRNNSVATALGRDMIERLKDNPDLIPEEIVPVRYSGGNPVVDSSLDPLGLGPLGDAIGSTGILTNGGAQVTKEWMLSSGPNRARRIVGEGHRIPAPRAVGTIGSGAQRYESYGGVLVLDHGPVAENSVLVAYGNDLSRTVGAPRDTSYILSNPNDPSSTVPVTLGTYDADNNPVTFTGQAMTTTVSLAPYEFFVVGADTPGAAILVPANHRVARSYRVRMSAYVGTPAGVKRYDYLSLRVNVPSISDTTVPLVRIPLAPLLAYTTEVQNGGTLYAVESESIRFAPQYAKVASWTADTNNNPIDPFEMKVVDGNLGVLLFSPAGREGVVDRPGAVSEPLTARIDYDVRDWRIIGEDFRVVNGAGKTYTYPLGLQSLKVGSSAGPDGRVNGGMFGAATPAEPTGDSYDPAFTPRDNVVVLDLTTGFEVQRYAVTGTHPDGPGGATRTDADANGTDPASVLVAVDKSRGSITLNDADATTSDVLDVKLIAPTGGTITVPAKNRTFRVLYRARQEWAVQIFKGASQYTLVNSLASPLAPDQAILGSNVGGSTNRIYFPNSEAGHKVTIDRIAYLDGAGTDQVLEGQDFLVRPAKPTETPSLAYIDLTDVVGTSGTPGLPAFSTRYGTPVQGIKGASVSVRVLWNPEAFNLSANATDNITRADQWGRGWRKSTTDTYLRAEETR